MYANDIFKEKHSRLRELCKGKHFLSFDDVKEYITDSDFLNYLDNAQSKYDLMQYIELDNVQSKYDPIQYIVKSLSKQEDLLNEANKMLSLQELRGADIYILSLRPPYAILHVSIFIIYFQIENISYDDISDFVQKICKNNCCHSIDFGNLNILQLNNIYVEEFGCSFKMFYHLDSTVQIKRLCINESFVMHVMNMNQLEYSNFTQKIKEHSIDTIIVPNANGLKFMCVQNVYIHKADTSHIIELHPETIKIRLQTCYLNETVLAQIPNHVTIEAFYDDSYEKSQKDVISHDRVSSVIFDPYGIPTANEQKITEIVREDIKLAVSLGKYIPSERVIFLLYK